MIDDTSTRMAEAEAAKAALTQFLRPAFDVARLDYIEKLASIAAKPLTADNRAGLEKLALAVKVVDQVRAQIESLVTDGKVAEADRDRARKIEKIPVTTRNLLGY